MQYNADVHLVSGFALAKNQTIAMFKKKILITYRNWILVLLQFVIPICFILLAVMEQRLKTGFADLPDMKISLMQYHKTIALVQINPTYAANSLEKR